VIYGIKSVVDDGLGLGAATSLWTGVLVGIVFTKRQQRLTAPMIDPRLFRVPSFSAPLAANALALFAVFGLELFIAQYLQLVLGMGPLEAGLWTLPGAAGFIVGSNLAPVLAARLPTAQVVAGGAAVAAAGLALLTQVGPESGLLILSVGSVVMSLGAAQVVTLSTDLVVGAAPPERAGTASGMSETGAELGGALGIALLGSLGTAVFRSEAEGHETLGGALEAADGLPAAVYPALQAFADGMQAAALVAAVLMLAVAALTWRLLRRPEPQAEVAQAAAAASCA
jgi:DHA2 family multidrug resistance protein-like MFS transporter